MVWKLVGIWVNDVEKLKDRPALLEFVPPTTAGGAVHEEKYGWRNTRDSNERVTSKAADD